MLRRLGKAFSWLTKRRPALKEVAIVIIGLDNAGKTTIMHAIRGGEACIATAPPRGRRPSGSDRGT